MEKIVLENHDPELNPDSETLSRVVLTRMGLNPRKKDGTQNMHKL